MKKTITILLFTCLCSPALAQNYVIEYESTPGFRLGLQIEPFDTNRLDFNGDGTAELTLLRVDEQDNPVEMDVIEVATGATLWTFDVQALAADGFRFKGFFDLDADNVREPAFFSKDAAAYTIIDPLTNTAELEVTGVARATVADIDGDGRNELIVGNRDTRTVQVYGSGDTGTATEEDIARTLHRLFQNYPNPFHEATTIGYEVEQAGPVTITVYDILGRAVRMLVDEAQPVGTYHIAWDGRDAGGRAVASGTYFYRLRVSEAVSSKQAIRVK